MSLKIVVLSYNPGPAYFNASISPMYNPPHQGYNLNRLQALMTGWR